LSVGTISEDWESHHNSGQESDLSEHERAICAADLERAASRFDKRLSSISQDCDGLAEYLHNNLAGRKNL
jgi:hypothetical protein